MIRKVRRKFTVSAMAAMTFVTVLLIAVINLVNFYYSSQKADKILKELNGDLAFPAMKLLEETESPYEGMPDSSASDGGSITDDGGQGKDPASQSQDGAEADIPENNDGLPEDSFAPPDVPEDGGRRAFSAQYSDRYFSVYVSTDGDYQVLRNTSSFLEDQTALKLAEKVKKTGKSSGYCDEYRFLVSEGGSIPGMPADNPVASGKGSDSATGTDNPGRGKAVISLLDCSTDFDAMRSLLLISALVGFFGLFLVFWFVSRMAKKAVLPLEESMEKQKRFITDAGHELKTPISVIGTNMDVLEMDLPGNEWVQSTKRQVRRLRTLVTQLISLSRLEEGQQVPKKKFSFSDAASECVEAYEMISGKEGRKLSVSIKDGIFAFANEDQIRQILTILCDNAMKYAESGIEFSLSASGKQAVFETRNDWAQDVKKEDLDKLFERFYRADASRNRDSKKSGYGLGLSIAQAAALQNGGKLEVSEDEKNRLVFRLSLPRAM